jgi:toxin ParE1/3/4
LIVLPIIRTDRADEDLIALWTSIAADNPNAADRVLDAIERRWQQLAQHPLSGMARDDIAAGVRHLVVGQYLTLYRVSDEGIEIIRVLHGRRKIGRDTVD